MPSLATLVLATALFHPHLDAGGPRAERLSGRSNDRGPKVALELALTLEVPPMERDLVALLPITERLYSTEGWFGVLVSDEVALLVDVRIEGPMSRGDFTAALGIAVLPWSG